MPQAESESERRNYFRIVDHIALQYRIVENNHPSTAEAEPLSPYDSQFQLNDQFKLLSEIRQIEAESRPHLHAISEQDRHVAAYLRALNRKIECLASLVSPGIHQHSISPTHQANLCEGGVSLDLSDPITVGALLHLTITLFPSYYCFAALATAIHCEPHSQHQSQHQASDQAPDQASDKSQHDSHKNSQTFNVGLQFKSLMESDRQMLAKHILQKQSLDRRKQNMDSPS